MSRTGLEGIPRRSLRTELRERLRREIAEGRIPPSAKVNEADLARLAGVSRTPVREALLLLEAEGFLESDTGRGFFTSPLTVEEAAEIYPILADLEGLALRLAGIPDADVLRRLELLNADLGRVSDDPLLAAELDRQWHGRLLAGCGNRRLHSEIRRLKELVRRYEITYMRDEGRIATSVGQHEQVVAALRSGRLAAAVRALERNWSVTFEQLAPWLRDRTAGSRGPDPTGAG